MRTGAIAAVTMLAMTLGVTLRGSTVSVTLNGATTGIVVNGSAGSTINVSEPTVTVAAVALPPGKEYLIIRATTVAYWRKKLPLL